MSQVRMKDIPDQSEPKLGESVPFGASPSRLICECGVRGAIRESRMGPVPQPVAVHFEGGFASVWVG